MRSNGGDRFVANEFIKEKAAVERSLAWLWHRLEHVEKWNKKINLYQFAADEKGYAEKAWEWCYEQIWPYMGESMEEIVSYIDSVICKPILSLKVPFHKQLFKTITEA